MRYQLVLQWLSTASTADYDKLIEIEELLAENLSGDSEVDGHDVGTGEMNIFIMTNDPLHSLEQVKLTLEKLNAWASVRAAYRELAGDKYTVLWPKGLTNFGVT